tara:strand:- start:175 stop:342 length:168 start_codon:yes stop_codon:yes gene_type:complete
MNKRKAGRKLSRYMRIAGTIGAWSVIYPMLVVSWIRAERKATRENDTCNNTSAKV